MRFLVLVLLLSLSACQESLKINYADVTNLESLSQPSIVLKNPIHPIGIDATPEFTISDVNAGATVELFSDACVTKIAEATANGTTIDITSSILPKGVYQLYARQRSTQGVSSCSVIYADYQLSGTPMVSVWQTTVPGETITLPLRTGFNYNLLVDWGDGSSKSIITAFDDVDITHAYASAGVQTITIMGTAEAWYFNNAGDKLKIYQVTELGDLNWKNFQGAFWGCTNLTTFAGGTTNQVTSMIRMFGNATNVTPDTSNWDTSAVTSMQAMFVAAASANPDTSNWDTSAVTSMASMFYDASSANPDTSNWNTANVTSMGAMFRHATVANPITSSWDTSKVTSMRLMFQNVHAANPDTSGWDTSLVTDMYGMFYDAISANPDTTNWNTSSVTDMGLMFYLATSANPDMSSWNFANVTAMNFMFAGTAALSIPNYSTMLNRIAATSIKTNIPLDAGAAKYNVGSAAARATLVGNGWTIIDGGPE